MIRQQFNNSEKYHFLLRHYWHPSKRTIGVKKIEPNNAPGKARAERQHFEEKLSGSLDPFKGGIKAYPEKHQKSEVEHVLENDMCEKKRVAGFEGKRNELPMKSLGDKPYKFAEDSTDFYKEGGLIPGSTHPEKIEKKGAGNAKIVDYYATLDLSKATLNKGLTWKEKVKQEQLMEDRKAVNDLIVW